MAATVAEPLLLRTGEAKKSCSKHVGAGIVIFLLFSSALGIVASRWENSAIRLHDTPLPVGTVFMELPPPGGDRWYVIQNVAYPRLVMGIRSSDPKPGADIVTWTLGDNWDKMWRYTEDHYIENIRGLVMSVNGDNQSPAAFILTSMKNDGWQQKWRLTPDGQIVNERTGLAMAIEYASTALLGQILTWWCCQGWDKRWQFVPVIQNVEVFPELIFWTDGGSEGSKEIKVETGVSTDQTFSEEFKTQAKLSMSSTLDAFSAKMSMQVTSDLKQTFSEHMWEKRTDTVTVNFNKPAYVYQLQIVVSSPLGTLVAKGHQFVLSHPLPQ